MNWITQFALPVVIGLGSGVVVALVNHWLTSRRGHADYLREQLQRVYGPIVYCKTVCDANEELVEELGKESDLYLERIADSQKKVSTTEIRNKGLYNHVKVMWLSYNKIAKILEENYSYLDPHDVPLIKDFIKANETWAQCSPIEELGEYSEAIVDNINIRSALYGRCLDGLARHDFFVRIDERFLAKQKQLHKLGGMEANVLVAFWMTASSSGRMLHGWLRRSRLGSLRILRGKNH